MRIVRMNNRRKNKRGACGKTPKMDGSGGGTGNRKNRVPTKKKTRW